MVRFGTETFWSPLSMPGTPQARFSKYILYIQFVTWLWQYPKGKKGDDFRFAAKKPKSQDLQRH